MSSHVVGAALGGAPADRPSSEDNGRQQQQHKKDSEPVVTTAGKDSRSANTARRTGGGQAPSKTQTGNNECQFFFEDEVFRIDRRGRVHFGVITETAESYSSDEEEEVDEVLAKGEVRVAFYPDGKEVVHTEQAIGLADRTLMPGDVVRRCMPGQKNLIGQAGYVRDVNVRADVKVLGSKYVIKNVPAERLRPISEWTRDVPVCLGTWIGTTVNVDECAVLKSVNGGRIEITSNDFHKFKDAVSPCAREVFNPNVYYPGNVVVGRLPPQDRIKNLTPDISLPTNRKSRAVYTVESIRTTSVNVAWTCRAISQGENGPDVDPLKHPKTNIKGEDLDGVKRLNIYESYMLQIHDRFYLKYSKCDTLVKHTDWEEEQAEKYLTIFQRQRLENMVEKNPPANSPAPSSSGNARKFRRLVSKPSVMKLPRPISDKHLSQSASKNQSGDNEEAWESGDDEEDEETVPETLEPAESPEKLAGGADVAESPSAADDGTPQAPKNATRYIKPRRHIKKKIRSVKKLIGSPFSKKELDPKDGDEIVVETLVVYSSVTVVWQDGSVEAGIHSTQLYPIHHLDNHEFFPGDFVNKANENSTGTTDYGVIQCVDHDERIAKVKWFNIYSKADNPVPTCRESEELSVYDLKDHSDYQYRPGTMVIRVSNFTGEDINSTAGQVIDNFPDGRVRVWWAKGHITMCYPQDLFEINHTDQEHDGYDSDQSGDSWETQSENSQVNMSLSSLEGEEHILKGVDLAREAVKRLEKSYRVLPCIRKPEVLLDLVSVYKNCVFLDSMFNTNFFHEEHFQGIVRRKRSKKGSPCHDCGICGEAARATTPEAAAKILADVAAAIAGHSSQTPTKRKSSSEVDEVQCKKTTATTVNEDSEEEEEEEEDDEGDEDSMCELKLTESESKLSREELIAKLHTEFTEMFKEAQDSIHKAFEIHMKSDSGIVHSRQENAGEETNDLRNKSLKEIHVELMAKPNVDVCEVFCFLMKEQLAKCRKLIIETYKQAKSEKNDEEEVSDAEEATEDDDPAQADNEAMEQPLNLNGLSESLPPIPGPMACSSPSAIPGSVDPDSPPLSESCFQVLPNAPASHHFIGTSITPANKSQYQRAVQREYRMLQASLPPGVIVRAYEDRMDLMSVMMVGPKRTPYQNALFFFDFQMGREYPKNPPVCHYISYCTERLNPNLYEEGKVCVSLLGTWSGRDTEVWSPTSTMLQVLVSIQGLILVDEPYYNEAGYEKQRGTQLGNENSRVYNEMAIIKIAHSTVKQLKNPPLIFRQELIDHFKEFGGELHGRMQAWSEYSLEAQRRRITCIKDMPEEYKAPCDMPEFPLLPCSRGFCIAVKGVLAQLQTELTALEASSPVGKEEPSGIETSAGAGTAPRAAPEEV